MSLPISPQNATEIPAESISSPTVDRIIDAAKCVDDLQLAHQQAQDLLSAATSDVKSAETEVGRLENVIINMLKCDKANKPIYQRAMDKLGDARECYVEQYKLRGDAFNYANSVSLQLSLAQHELKSLKRRKD